MRKMFLVLISLICLAGLVFAEEKPAGRIIPKLTAAETIDAPTIVNSGVHPSWGVPCTNYTYFAIYKDEKGRSPEYMRINLNNQWYDMKSLKGDPKTGATYVYNYVPDSGSSNFYYFEASNGVGKTRASIIDSPDNGPLLFSEKLDNNEIVLLDKNGKEIWHYDIGKDWIEGVAISKDGNYIAAVTNFYIYLFSKESNKPLWSFCKVDCENPSVVSGNFAGIAISFDGSYIAADMQGTLYLFSRESNKPVWIRDIESGAIGIDMSDDAGVIASGTGNAGGGKGQKIFLFDKEGNKLGEYKPEYPDYEQTGDFYQPDITPDGKYVAISTGCPDRRAYLFSGTGELLFRSEQMTYDSPVHKSAISDDGSLIAYSADHQQGKEIVFLYNKEGKKVWSFSSQEDSTARAVSISADGNYIAAGTSTGHIYLFSKNNNKPLWRFTESGRFVQFGDVKLNSDGSLLSAAGTTKKVYLFSKDSNKPLWEYQANTWITKIDFNGNYIVAGTGPREYFFEGESLGPDKIQCGEVIRPEPFETYFKKIEGDAEGEWIETGEKEAVCGDDRCAPPGETYENCPQDCCPPAGCEDGFGDKESDKEEGEGQKGIICGNNICEDPEENKDTCPKDCLAAEEKENKSFFQYIIGFFRRLFGK